MSWKAPVPVRLVAASAVVALALVACTPDKTQVSPSDGPGPDASGTAAPPSAEVTDVYNQDLQWSECDELECATIQVPLDWSEPDGDTITVSLNRHAARNPDARVGSLLINPGGPGGSGLGLTESLATTGGDA